MDIGLSSRERSVVQLARRKRLCPKNRVMWVMPWWLVVLLALALMTHSYGLSLLLVPLLAAWQRHRIRQQISDWALDLRHL